MAHKADNLSAEFVRASLHYDPETGVFTRRLAAGNKPAGSVSGTRLTRGYLGLGIGGFKVNAHRLAFLYMTGEWPKGVVDHINGITSDNRWCNLRDVSLSQNSENQRRAKARSASGYLGVSLLKGRPRAAIRVNKKLIHLGTFDTPEAAHQAYVEAKRKLHAGCTI